MVLVDVVSFAVHRDSENVRLAILQERVISQDDLVVHFLAARPATGGQVRCDLLIGQHRAILSFVPMLKSVLDFHLKIDGLFVVNEW